MEQKIFNSDKSRIKVNLEFEPHTWLNRASRRNIQGLLVECINFFGDFAYAHSYYMYDIAPTCAI